MFTGFNEVDKEIVEIKRVLRERLVQRATAFNVGLDVEN